MTALRERTGLSLYIADVADYERLRKLVQAKLGQSAADARFGEGRALLELARGDGSPNERHNAVLAALAKPPQRSAPQAPNGLTPRELDVLPLVAAGKKDQEIADALFISINTAQNHVKSIREKLGVRNRTEIGVRARELGLL